MIRYTLLIVLAAIVGSPRMTQAADPQLAHAVYFKLKDGTQANKDKLVDACYKYLTNHEGTVYFAAGVLAEDLDREVNDMNFDVSLLIVFRNKAAHDKYADHPRHLEFIEKNQALWSGVRVFDSYIPAAKQKDAQGR